MYIVQFGFTHSDLRPPAIPPTTLFSAVPTAAAYPWIPAQNQQVPSVQNRNLAYNQSYTVQGAIHSGCHTKVVFQPYCVQSQFINSLGYSPRSILRLMMSWIQKRRCFFSLLLLLLLRRCQTYANNEISCSLSSAILPNLALAQPIACV